MSALIAALPVALSPADSARAVAEVYSISLLATVPLATVGGAVIVLQRASAETRALLWRSTMVALLLIYFGHLSLQQGLSLEVPTMLALPLVALGRVQLSAAPYVANGAANDNAPAASVVAWALLFAYAVGVVTVLITVLRGWLAARAVVGRARQVSNPCWLALAAEVQATLGIRRAVPLMQTSELRMPATCGIWRPVVLLPENATVWPDGDVRAVLLHELAHVRGRDIAFALLGTLACALYWFHPGVWLVAKSLHDDSEHACDNRVLSAGIRPSEYAALLADVADGCSYGAVAAPFGGRRVWNGGSLRGRLAAIVDQRLSRATPTRGAVIAVALTTLVIGVPTSVARLSPTRELLTRLMADRAWETRAYAVIGLARRTDSVAVVRDAAALDPSPRVRAMAVAALDLH